MRKITIMDRLRYKFDDIMSRGTVALLVWLGLASLVLILGIALLDAFTGVDVRDDGSHFTFLQLAWMDLLRTLDPGTMGSDTGTNLFLGSMLIVTLGGIFIVSTLIGIISNGITLKLDELRKGRSLVVENGHTVILGWSASIFSILRELACARTLQEKCIVILAPLDKVWMEDELRAHCGRLEKTRVVCRTGDPLHIHDLEIANPDSARAIIIPAPDATDPDAHVIKSILALVNRAGRTPDDYHIVAELRDPDNLSVAQLVGGAEAEFVLASDLLSRLTVQTCRQSGLSVVYEDLLSFRGSELYFAPVPVKSGTTFAEALMQFPACVLIGVLTGDGRQLLNPPPDYIIQESDQAILIAEDVSTIKLDPVSHLAYDESALRVQDAVETTPERTLILGWNRRAPNLIAGLEAYVSPQSAVTVVSDAPNVEAQIQALEPALSKQTIRYVNASPTNRRTLDRMRLETYHHVVLVSSVEQYDVQEADAHTLITLLHLRALDGSPNRPFSITSEMMDPHNRELAQVAQPDDFIVSTQLVSLVLAQLAENPRLASVFAELFSPEGSEIYLRPAVHYVAAGHPVDFYTLTEAARRRGEIAIGYRRHSEAFSAAKNYGVRLNPVKAEMVTFTEADRIIVLAES